MSELQKQEQKSALKSFFSRFQPRRSNTSGEPNSIDRRTFLKGLGVMAGKIALDGVEKTVSDIAKLHKTETSLSQESGEQLSREPHAVFVDFPLDFDPEEYTLEIMEQLGFSREDVLAIGSIQMLDVARFQTDDVYALKYGISEYLSRVTNHGEMTSQAWQETISENGFQANPVQVHSIAELFSAFSYQRREDGGMSLRFQVDKNRLPSQWFSEGEEVINNSFQYGEQGVDIVLREEIPFEEFLSDYSLIDDQDNEYVVLFDVPASEREGVMWMEDLQTSPPSLVGTLHGEERRYPGVPIDQLPDLAREYSQHVQSRALDYPRVQVVEAYSHEFQEENFRSVFELATQYPDKLFVISSGNTNSYFYDFIQGQLVPENILIVGLKFPDDVPPVSDGATLLVPSSLRDPFVNGSSEGAAIVSAIASALQAKGMSVSEAKQKILDDFCENASYVGEHYQTRQGKVLQYYLVRAFFESES